MTDQRHDLALILRSRAPLIVIETADENRVLDMLQSISMEQASDNYLPLFRWTITDGLQRLDIDLAPQTINSDPVDVLKPYLAALEPELGNELLAAPFQHLGNAIQDLTAQVGAAAGPARLRLARRHDRVAKILAAAAADVGDHPALAVFERDIASGLRARELAVDVDLVGLRDRHALTGLFRLRRHDYASSSR